MQIINDENLSTFHYYLEQNYIHPSSPLVFKTFSTKEITSIYLYGYDEISNKLLKIVPLMCSPLTYICNKYPSSPLVFKTFSTKEITSIIKLLKSKTSHGYDEISNKLLKIVPLTCSPLTYICNKSILSGIFPDSLKFTITKPIFKKGDTLKVINYRPISLLMSFSKVFEKALYVVGQFSSRTRHRVLVVAALDGLMTLTYQRFTAVVVVVDIWQCLSEWHLLLSACVLVCRCENVGA